MIIVSKTAAEMAQRTYDVKWSLYKVYPRYAGDEFLDTYLHTRTHETVYREE
jgi:hypothetical protein